MLTKPEISALMKSVGGIVREYVSAAIVTLTSRLDEFDARIKAIPAGPKGEPGESIIGPKGDTGDRGADGESTIGPAGPVGPHGKQGEPGRDGESIRGEKGEPGESIVGPIGPAGPQGGIGPKGHTGDSGVPGTTGDKGLDGKDGRDGRDGIGKDGRDGENGRDALQIEILPMIDPAKSFPRGTFAQHEGGIIRSRVNTTPGEFIDRTEWEVIQRGVYGVRFNQGEDPRVISFECGMTGGIVHRQDFRIPMPLIQGIFKDGTEYQKADILQFGGSLWMVRADKTSSRPDEQHADWQLIVRRGRDGKPGLNGKDGERGAEGPRGKDLTQMDFTGKKH